jgi:hypothetical protein
MSSIGYREALSIPGLTLYRPAEASELRDDIISSLERPGQQRRPTDSASPVQPLQPRTRVIYHTGI